MPPKNVPSPKVTAPSVTKKFKTILQASSQVDSFVTAPEVLVLNMFCNWESHIIAAVDSLAFVIGWFTKFPEYQHNDVYLLGESYTGIHIHAR